jgi:hypothetical protein
MLLAQSNVSIQAGALTVTGLLHSSIDYLDHD